MPRFGFLVCGILLGLTQSLWPQSPQGLPRLTQTIEMPGVQNRLDHMDIDVQGKRLFVAALENDSLEVLDLTAGMVSKSLKNLGGPQGIAYVPETNELFVAARNTGDLLVLDGATFREKKRFSFGDEADNLHYLPSRSLLILGYGSGGVAFLDAKTDTLLGTIALGGHPEGLQGQISGNRVLVNVPGALYSLELAKHSVIAKWSPAGVMSNFPMAVQETRSRGAYFTHVPRQITVFDTATGKTLSQRDAPPDVDDLFFDDTSDRLFVVSGAGRLELWSVPESGPMVSLGWVPTGEGARTGLYSAAMHRFFVAAPARNGKPARVLVFETS